VSNPADKNDWWPKSSVVTSVQRSYIPSFQFGDGTAATKSGVLGLKKVSGAGICNFLTDTANFRQNSERQLKIFAKEDYECSELLFCPYFSV